MNQEFLGSMGYAVDEESDSRISTHRKVSCTILDKSNRFNAVEFIVDTGAKVSMMHEEHLKKLDYDYVGVRRTYSIGGAELDCPIIQIKGLVLKELVMTGVKFAMIPAGSVRSDRKNVLRGYDILGENILEFIEPFFSYSTDLIYYRLNKKRHPLAESDPVVACVDVMLQDVIVQKKLFEARKSKEDSVTRMSMFK